MHVFCGPVILESLFSFLVAQNAVYIISELVDFISVSYAVSLHVVITTDAFSFTACCRHNILFCIRSHCNGYMVLHHDYMCVCVFA